MFKLFKMFKSFKMFKMMGRSPTSDPALSPP